MSEMAVAQPVKKSRRCQHWKSAVVWIVSTMPGQNLAGGANRSGIPKCSSAAALCIIECMEDWENGADQGCRTLGDCRSRCSWWVYSIEHVQPQYCSVLQVKR